MHDADRFQIDCLRTSDPPEDLCPETLQKRALGKVLEEMTQISERADVLKKHLFYGRDADLSSLQDGPEHTPQSRAHVKIIHAILGIQSELREVLDGLLRGDDVTVKEDLGDILWYVSEGLDGIGCTMSEAMSCNTAKLRVRFPEKFSGQQAIHKDSARERLVLEDPSS